MKLNRRVQPLNKRALILNSMLTIGLVLLAKGLYMDVKAHVAQVLIEHSWQSKSGTSTAEKPWWWADTKAIATLEVPRLNKRLFVMQDDSGESLAFGPGHLNASAPINSDGHVMIAGHRDSHFEFLQHIKTGDIIQTTGSNNHTMQYRVSDAYVLDSSKESLMKYDHDELTLITCYPFNSLFVGGPLRFVVNAEPITVEATVKTPLTNQTKPRHQPSHYSKKPENKARFDDHESAIADT